MYTDTNTLMHTHTGARVPKYFLGWCDVTPLSTPGYSHTWLGVQNLLSVYRPLPWPSWCDVIKCSYFHGSNNWWVLLRLHVVCEQHRKPSPSLGKLLAVLSADSHRRLAGALWWLLLLSPLGAGPRGHRTTSWHQQPPAATPSEKTWALHYRSDQSGIMYSAALRKKRWALQSLIMYSSALFISSWLGLLSGPFRLCVTTTWPVVWPVHISISDHHMACSQTRLFIQQWPSLFSDLFINQAVTKPVLWPVH